MKFTFFFVFILWPSFLSAATEYIHFMNSSSKEVQFIIEDFVELKSIHLGPGEALTIRLDSIINRVTLKTKAGTAGANGKYIVVDSNDKSLVSGLIIITKDTGYNLNRLVLNVTVPPNTKEIFIREQ